LKSDRRIRRLDSDRTNVGLLMSVVLLCVQYGSEHCSDLMNLLLSYYALFSSLLLHILTVVLSLINLPHLDLLFVSICAQQNIFICLYISFYWTDSAALFVLIYQLFNLLCTITQNLIVIIIILIFCIYY